MKRWGAVPGNNLFCSYSTNVLQWALMKRLALFSCIIFFCAAGSLFFLTRSSGSEEVSLNSITQQRVTPSTTPVSFNMPPTQYVIGSSRFVSQTFNNCGPASLSMVMSMMGKDITQQELASIMRPFNNPAGGVDDKSIFAHEFVKTAKQYGFESLSRPNGNEELIKKLVANDIPVVVRTWLHPSEDIGHFRIVRGYDDTRSVFIQDDSYEGPNIEYSYETFSQMWKPFNYGYILVYPKEKNEVVKAILGEEYDEKKAWENAQNRAEEETASGKADPYSHFNVATASYYLGDYEKSIREYEKVGSALPSRMLWYQYEILDAYLKTKQYDKVLSLATEILNRGNTAYSEMYLMRGYVYKEQGNIPLARQEFEKALYYNVNSNEAKSALASVATSES